MSKLSVPRCGSIAFSPRKKARKQYFTARGWKHVDGKKLSGFAGYKAGMIHLFAVDKQKTSPAFEQTIMIPATIIECPPIKVFAIKAYKKVGTALRCTGQENSEKSDKNLARRLCVGPSEKPIDASTASQIRLVVHTQPAFKKTPEVFEIPVNAPAAEAYEYAKSVLGKDINVADVLEAGMQIDVVAVTKGHGIQGPIKRWGARIHWRKSTKMYRHVGCINPWTPKHIMWTALMPGQMGYHRRTELNKLVLKVGTDGKDVTPIGGIPHYGIIRKNYILVKGSIGGPKKRAVMMRIGFRPKKNTSLPDIKTISTRSQQGRGKQ